MTSKRIDLSAAKRVDVLNKLELLQIDTSGSFDRLTRIVTKVLDAPVSLATMVEEDHQWFLGCTGIKEPYASTRKTPMSHSFCQHVVASQEPLIIEDARQHPLVHDNLAIRDLDVIAYLGIPLVTSEGVVIGSFCVIDDKPRKWNTSDSEIMMELAASVMTEIELRNQLKYRQEAEQTLTSVIRDREQLRIAKQMTLALSHDIRTPLSSIKLKIEMLSEYVTDTRLAGWIDSIKARLDKIITTLTNFHMMWSTTDELEIRKQDVDIYDVLRSSVEYARETPFFDPELASITLNQDNQLNLVHINQQLMKIAISNILENAVIYGYGRENHIRVHIITHVDAIQIDITDQGTGIPASDLPHIFDPLYKASEARTTSNSASGMGLTIARQIIEEHNGAITVESVEGKGTKFTVILPVYAQ